MGFFEVPDREPDADELEAWVEYGTPPDMPWLGPPRDMLPGALPEPLVMFRSDRVAVAISGIRVFATGFDCHVVSTLAPDFARSPEGRSFVERRFYSHPAYAGTEDDLRFGVLFSDGGKATSVNDDLDIDLIDPVDDLDEQADPPDGPVLRPSGGGDYGHWAEANFWIWPLPPPGPVTFVCEWPALPVPETSIEIDAAVFHAAAHSARPIWPEG